MSNYRFAWQILLSAIIIVAVCSNIGNNSVMAGENASDTVLVKGKFYTVDKENSWAEAVAIKDGTIVYVGSMEGIEPYIGKKTQVVDLKGQFAMPSFVDSHLHPLSNSYAINFQASTF